MKPYLVLVCLPLFLVACTGEPLANMDIFTADEAKALAEEFIVSSPTFSYDGYGLELVEARGTHNTFHLIYSFTSQYDGYGDRSEKNPRSGPVDHEVFIELSAGKVKSAIIDDAWDMLAQSATDTDMLVCPQDAKECEDGSFVSRDPANSCEFRPCPEDESYEQPKNYCRPNQRAVESCYEVYRPVCGHFEELCGDDACEENFDNDCFACKNAAVEYWTQGLC